MAKIANIFHTAKNNLFLAVHLPVFQKENIGTVPLPFAPEMRSDVMQSAVDNTVEPLVGGAAAQGA